MIGSLAFRRPSLALPSPIFVMRPSETTALCRWRSRLFIAWGFTGPAGRGGGQGGSGSLSAAGHAGWKEGCAYNPIPKTDEDLTDYRGSIVHLRRPPLTKSN